MHDKVFTTKIRSTDKVTESIATRQAVAQYSPRCLATRNYRDFVNELLSLKVGG